MRHANTLTQACICVYKHALFTHAHTHMYVYLCTHMSTYTCEHIVAHAGIYSNMNVYLYSHTDTPVYALDTSIYSRRGSLHHGPDLPTCCLLSNPVDGRGLGGGNGSSGSCLPPAPIENAQHPVAVHLAAVLSGF